MIKAMELARAYRASPRQTIQDLQEALRRGVEGEPGGVSPKDFSIRDLAANLIMVGNEPIGHAQLAQYCQQDTPLMEAALDTTAFASLTRNVVNVAVLEGYDLPTFVLSRAVRTIPGRSLLPRIPGVSLPLEGDTNLEVAENEAIPTVGMGDEYAKGAETKKYGAIVAISKETVLTDETGMVLEQAARVGELIGMKREVVLTDLICGLNANCVTERRVGDVSEVTCNLFQDGTPTGSGGTGDRFTNQVDKTLTDWTDIGEGEQVIAAITLPGTENPVMLTRRLMLVPTQLKFTAARIIAAAETRSGSGNIVVAGNPVKDLDITLVSSPLVYSRQVAEGVDAADAAGRWFYGDLYRAVAWYQNWGVSVDEDRDGEAAFTNDTLARFKATIRGGVVATEPRCWAQFSPE
jgi:hypothetical protein